MLSENKLLITVAPCIPPYLADQVPNLDLSPEGIANEVLRACDAGANIVHLHVLNEHGKPTTELHAFKKTIALIISRCDIVIEGSTGGFNDLTPAERSTSLNADIEIASLNPGSVNYDQGVYINTPSDVRYWTEQMHKRGIKPDIAIFDTAMIHNSMQFTREGLISEPYIFTFVLGQQGAMTASARNLMFLSESVPEKSLCFVARHSGWDINLTVMNMSLGGHARAGFEDSPSYKSGELATSNAQLIERIVRIGRDLGREPATPAEARRMLGLMNKSG